MRKIIAILLLSVHLFNITGYTAVFKFLQKKASIDIANKLDKGAYKESELIEVKIPIPLPYITDWQEYERCDGEVEISGVIYAYVKRKLCRDTMYLLCIPNHEKMRITAAKNGVTQLTSDLASSGKEKSQPVASLNKQEAKEFSQFNTSYNFTAPLCLSLSRFYPSFSQEPSLRAIPVLLQPPKCG